MHSGKPESHAQAPQEQADARVRDALRVLASGGTWSREQGEAFFTDLLEGRLHDAQIGAALGLLAARGPTPLELLAGATVMRRHVTPIPGVEAMPGTVIDTCGTGGARKTFNISTLSAIVTAAAGNGRVRVAKHGNRGRSGRGSAEVIGALGVNVDAPPDVQARCLRECAVCFCFAIHHHPAMRHVAPARRALGFPTIFNLLGPLSNPARVSRQVLGVYRPEFVDLVAHTLAALGASRAMVVHADDGIDEISTTGPTRIGHVENGAVRIERFDPAPLGLPAPRAEDLDALDLDDAVRIARGVLAGHTGPARDIVLLNAAAALVVGGAASDWRQGVDAAADAIDSGAAARTLHALADLSRSA
ncbi:MAG: anthranilate phosphoribosyltransferase [Planctomycetota bacterium]|nr:anthranilate phosphoribosyltransferase [Planctomycetota bacterium]